VLQVDGVSKSKPSYPLDIECTFNSSVLTSVRWLKAPPYLK
jgi:hypothetical protein